MTSSFGYTDKVSTTKNIAVPQLSYAENFSKDSKKSVNGEIVINNTTTPMDQPERVRFALSNIKNIYDGTDVSLSSRAVSQAGVSLLVQLNDILRVTPDQGETCCCEPGYMDFPISTHIVIRTPLTQYITADTVMTVVKRNIAFLFGAGSDVTSARLNEMLRGSLLPPGIS